MRSQMGSIAGMLEKAPDEATPLQKELDRIGKALSLAVIIIAAVMIATIFLMEDIDAFYAVFDVLILGVALQLRRCLEAASGGDCGACPRQAAHIALHDEFTSTLDVTSTGPECRFGRLPNLRALRPLSVRFCPRIGVLCNLEVPTAGLAWLLTCRLCPASCSRFVFRC
jgi:hypothetical protein